VRNPKCYFAWLEANPNAIELKLGMMPMLPAGAFTAALGKVGEFLFARGGKGLLNGRVTGDLLRVGYSWSGSAKEGAEVFRIAVGSKRLSVHFHLDLWKR
jgi:hypothetical protein